MTPREKAERAQQLLNDPVLAGALDDIRAGFVTQLESLPIGDIDSQHHVTIALQVLKRLRTQLQKYASELAVDKAKERHDSFIARVRQRL